MIPIVRFTTLLSSLISENMPPFRFNNFNFKKIEIIETLQNFCEITSHILYSDSAIIVNIL